MLFCLRVHCAGDQRVLLSFVTLDSCMHTQLCSHFWFCNVRSWPAQVRTNCVRAWSAAAGPLLPADVEGIGCSRTQPRFSCMRVFRLQLHEFSSMDAPISATEWLFSGGGGWPRWLECVQLVERLATADPELVESLEKEVVEKKVGNTFPLHRYVPDTHNPLQGPTARPSCAMGFAGGHNGAGADVQLGG